MVVGVFLVAIALRDVFHTVLHPSGRGSLSRVVMRAVWRFARRRHRRGVISSLPGPAGMTLVIASWGCLVLVGCTFIYWAQMPDGFSYSASLRPAGRGDLLDAFYLSLVTLATLGFGDIVPTSHGMRIVAPLEALIGFTLLTAAVSWVLQIYPALARRRVLALHLFLLRSACTTNPDLGDNEPPAQILSDLALKVLQTRVDLDQYAVTYYYRDTDDRVALPAMLGYALDLAEAAARSEQRSSRLAGAVLGCAVQDLAHLLDCAFLRAGGDTRRILHAYGVDQGHEA
jgi:hypothetical protein